MKCEAVVLKYLTGSTQGVQQRPPCRPWLPQGCSSCKCTWPLFWIPEGPLLLKSSTLQTKSPFQCTWFVQFLLCNTFQKKSRHRKASSLLQRNLQFLSYSMLATRINNLRSSMLGLVSSNLLLSPPRGGWIWVVLPFLLTPSCERGAAPCGRAAWGQDTHTMGHSPTHPGFLGRRGSCGVHPHSTSKVFHHGTNFSS